MGDTFRLMTSGISFERTGWEMKRAFYSVRGSVVMAILLLQLPVFLFVHFKGAGAIYADMLGILVGIILLSWFFTSVVHGNRKILVFSLILLTVGTMLQCIFLKEALIRNPESFGDSLPAAGLQLQYILAMTVSAAVSFVYYRWRGISSMKMCNNIFSFTIFCN